jgi:arylsulfatase A-like enzyme
MGNVNTLLGGDGTTFDQAIDSFPLCCPSRATNLTGQYAHNHGVLHNNPPFGGFLQLDGSSTCRLAPGRGLPHDARGPLPERLRGEVRHPAGAGPTGSGSRTPPPSTTSPGRPFDHGVVRDYPDAAHPGEYLTDFETRKGVELIDDASNRDRPFYLSLWYTAPHRGSPRDPTTRAVRRRPPPPRATATRSPACGCRAPPSFNERDMYDKPQVVADRPRLSGELRAGVEENWRQENEALMAVDEGVAQIVEALRRNGQLDNTLIVFLSDNGFMHGRAPRARREGACPTRSPIRVPLVLRGPGVPARSIGPPARGKRGRDVRRSSTRPT